MARLELPAAKPLAIAVSGGPDSMALACLLRHWAQRSGLFCQGLIIDHTLRPGSEIEARQTQARLTELGLPADIITWRHDPITSRIHVIARKARYSLLAQACQSHGITHLLTAHQQEDQAETILMRLAKGSGVDGLAGMAARYEMNGVTILRPLLALPKARLIATCEAAGIEYITDPGNQATRFARGRLRQVMPLLAAEGLTVERLLDLGTRAAAAKQALDHYADRLIASSSWMDRAGVIRFDAAALSEAPRETALRCLGRALQAIHPQDYAPEQQGLEQLTTRLLSTAATPTRSLHGCLVSRQQTTIMLQREPAAITEESTIAAGETCLWDNRFTVKLNSQDDGKSFRIKALGLHPHAELDGLAAGLRHEIPQGRVRAALPALWQNDRLMAVPALADNDPSALASMKIRSNWPLFKPN